MFSIGGWLAAVMPTLAGSHGHLFKGADKRLPSDCPVDARPHPTECQSVAVRLAPTDGRRLRFEVDPSRPAPRTSEEAAEHFVELMREAVGQGYLPTSVPFADLRRFYDAIASEFDWPKIFYVHLSKLFERNGCTKTVKRDRRDGKDKRTVTYRLR